MRTKTAPVIRTQVDEAEEGETELNYLRSFLLALQAVRAGDFSVRLPSDQPGSPARSPTPSTTSLSPTSAWRSSSSMSARWSAARAGRAQRVDFGVARGAWGDMETSVNTLIDDLLWPTTAVTRADHRRGAGRPAADRAARGRRPAACRANSCARPRSSTR